MVQAKDLKKDNVKKTVKKIDAKITEHKIDKSSINKKDLQKENKVEKKAEEKVIIKKENKLIKKAVEKKKVNIKSIAFTILLVVILSYIGFYYRSGSYDLRAIEKGIESSVDAWVKDLIESDVNQMSVSPLQKVNLKDELYKDYLKNKQISLSAGEVKRSDFIKFQADMLKEQYTINKTPFLLAIDPYYYARQAKEYIQKGYYGDLQEDGTYLDNLRLAPKGNPNVSVEIHSKILANFYNVMHKDDEFNDADFFRSIYFFPVVVSILVMVLFFFFLKGYMNDILAFFSSILLGLSPTFLQRTIAGFTDTDAYNVFFPILVVIFLSYAIVNKNKIVKYLLAGFAGITQFLFLIIWGPGIFTYVIFNLALLGYIIFELSLKLRKKQNSLKDILIIFGIYNLILIIFTLVFGGNLINSILYLGSSTGLQDAVSRNIWPNIFTSVAELQSANYSNIFTQLSQGFLFFLLSFIGPIIYLFHINKYQELGFKDKKKKRNTIIFLVTMIWYLLFALNVSGVKIPIINSIYSLSLINNTLLQILFVIILYIPYIYLTLNHILFAEKNSKEFFLFLLVLMWYPITQFMVLKGIRFLLFTATPYAISLGLTFVCIFDLIKMGANFIGINSEKKQILTSKIISALMLFLLTIPFFTLANQIGDSSLPNVNDAWYSTLMEINEDSENAIITSWWDFGHFFIYFSERSVTFDGASQDGPQAYWVGRFLKAKTENESMGILRMLDCSENGAYDYVNEKTNDSIFSINLIEDLIEYNDKNLIEKHLEDTGKFTNLEIKEISDLMYCKEYPDAYIIASEDMVGKSGVWARWGSWDFEKAYIYKNRRNLTKEVIMEKFGYDEVKANKLLLEARALKSETDVNYWIAPVISYAQSASCQEVEAFSEYIVCENNVLVNKETQTPYLVIAASCSEKDDSFVCQQKKYTKDNRLLFNGYLIEEMYSLVGINEDELVEEIYNENNPYSVLFTTSNDGVQSLLMNKELSTSLFTKMFYLGGLGLNNFELSNVQSGMGSGTIYTYKVLWEGKPINETINSTNLTQENIEKIDSNLSINETIEIENSDDLDDLVLSNDSDVELVVDN
ncbi:MAG: STT3 domain-containing protein [Candidatus Nanoarchaeia archaeon]|nr:STT3 domain-containing protein [Candidatus Nanoarchaeia archaeon]